MATPVSTISEPMIRPSSVLPIDSAKPWLPGNSQRTPSAPTTRHSQDPMSLNPAQSYDVSTHSVQFVVAPGRTLKLQSTLPVVIRETLRAVPGFAGCMVMVSDQEARLVTVVTLWTGKERAHNCSENAARVKKLLSPYVDHWLRSDTHLAHFSMLSPLERKFQDCCPSESTSTSNP